jgi:hypothetical protein
LAHLGECPAEHPVIGDDQHADPGVLAASLAHRQRHGRGAVPQPHHLAQAGPGDQDDGSGVGQQVVVRPIRAEPAAVRDHVGLRQPGQYAADRRPQRFQASSLLRAGHPEQHIQAAAQLLRVRPELGGLQITPGGHGQAEQPAPRVEAAAAFARQPVDEVAARGVALSEQHRPRPDRGEGHRRSGDPGRPLVSRDGDQHLASPTPGARCR